MVQNNFIVEIVLENKKRARDPVAEVISRDLIAKKGYSMISDVRSGQYLRMHVSSDTEENATDTVRKMCNELRIFNPVTQDLNILKVTEQK